MDYDSVYNTIWTLLNCVIAFVPKVEAGEQVVVPKVELDKQRVNEIILTCFCPCTNVKKEKIKTT